MNFKIPSIPPTTNKCIRFPNDVIDGVEFAIQGKQCTFTAFVIEAVRSALESLDIQPGEVIRARLDDKEITKSE